MRWRLSCSSPKRWLDCATPLLLPRPAGMCNVAACCGLSCSLSLSLWERAGVRESPFCSFPSRGKAGMGVSEPAPVGPCAWVQCKRLSPNISSAALRPHPRLPPRGEGARGIPPLSSPAGAAEPALPGRRRRPCRPQGCETHPICVPSKPAPAGSEPRHAAPSGGSELRAASERGGLCS